MSFIVLRKAGEDQSGRSLNISLSNSDRPVGHGRHGGRGRPGRPGRYGGSRRHRDGRGRNELVFGISSQGYPFMKSSGRVNLSAPSIKDDLTYLFVAKVVVGRDGSTESYLRVYNSGEQVEKHEPRAWSITGKSGPGKIKLSRIRMMVGANSAFNIDELKLGRSWQSVTTAP